MSLVVNNTGYNGEVVDEIFTAAILGNEMAEAGLMHVIPGVTQKVAIPRLKISDVLQPFKSQMSESDFMGDYEHSEKFLIPNEVMAAVQFDPNVYKNVWRKYQPTGPLVFRELPSNVQTEMLKLLGKKIQRELGNLYVNGKYVKGAKGLGLMNGLITRLSEDEDVLITESSATTVTGKLKDLVAKIPAEIRDNPSLRIIMSTADFNTYDEELTNRESKGVDETTIAKAMYKNIPIVKISTWPEGLFFSTICSTEADSNIFLAVNLSEDSEAIKIGPVNNFGSMQFFKMAMSADINVAFGEECVVLDTREDPQFEVSTGSDSSSSTDSDNTSDDQAV